jgi:hypothetical protein
VCCEDMNVMRCFLYQLDSYVLVWVGVQMCGCVL